MLGHCSRNVEPAAKKYSNVQNKGSEFGRAAIADGLAKDSISGLAIGREFVGTPDGREETKIVMDESGARISPEHIEPPPEESRN